MILETLTSTRVAKRLEYADAPDKRGWLLLFHFVVRDHSLQGKTAQKAIEECATYRPLVTPTANSVARHALEWDMIQSRVSFRGSDWWRTDRLEAEARSQNQALLKDNSTGRQVWQELMALHKDFFEGPFLGRRYQNPRYTNSHKVFVLRRPSAENNWDCEDLLRIEGERRIEIITDWVTEELQDDPEKLAEVLKTCGLQQG